MSVNPSEVHSLLSRDYFVMAFLVSLGTLQVAVSIGGYRGLYLLPWTFISRFAGVALVIAGVLFFFLAPLWVDGPWASGSVGADSSVREWGRAAWADLGHATNINDIDGGLSGGDQALWFPVATGLALTLSIASGFVGMKFRSGVPGHISTDDELEPRAGEDGLDALKDGDFQGALGQSLGEMNRTFRRDAVAAWSAAPSWALPKFIARRLGR